MKCPRPPREILGGGRGRVRVLSVYPGKTATPMQAAIYAAAERPYEPQNLLQPEDVAEIVLAAYKRGDVSGAVRRHETRP